MSTTTNLPYHLPSKVFSTENKLTSQPSQKTILDLLNTKCSTSLHYLKQVHAMALRTGHFQDHYVSGCLENNEPCKAIWCYYKMTVAHARPNKFTYPTLLKACTVAEAAEEGSQAHAHVIKQGLSGDVHIRSAGIQMYGSF
ncbi:hypothetical protein OIU78_021364, partial [Salix suchowensis]